MSTFIVYIQIVYADKFEREFRDSFNGSVSGVNDIDLTVAEYCKNWLERRKGELAFSTINHYMSSIIMIEKYMGNIKLKKITPFIIQRFYDQLDGLKKSTGFAIGKMKLAKIISTKNLSSKIIAEKTGLSEDVVVRANKYCKIKVSSVNKIANVIGKDVHELFKVCEVLEPFAYETISKYKRCLRAILSTAKKQRIIQDNYASADYITFSKRPDRDIELLDDEQAKEFFSRLKDYPKIRIKTALITVLLTGVRRENFADLIGEILILIKD